MLNFIRSISNRIYCFELLLALIINFFIFKCFQVKKHLFVVHLLHFYVFRSILILISEFIITNHFIQFFMVLLMILLILLIIIYLWVIIDWLFLFLFISILAYFIIIILVLLFLIFSFIFIVFIVIKFITVYMFTHLPNIYPYWHLFHMHKLKLSLDWFLPFFHPIHNFNLLSIPKCLHIAM